MKKLYYFLLMALPVIMFASCDDKDNLPDVDVSITVDGGVSVDNVLYVVQGDVLKIESVNVTNRQAGKNAALGPVTYIWDGIPVGVSVEAPFGAEFNTENMAIGKHILQLQAPVYAVDKSVGRVYMVYKVQIVEDAADIPEGDQSAVLEMTTQVKEN